MEQETATPSAQGATCANCGAPLYGDYCYHCGQPVKGLVRHLSGVLGDVFDTVLNIDSRVLRTLPALFLRPGYLCKSGYEWTQHARIGLREGLTQDEIERLKKGADIGWGPADAALIRAADELHADQFIRDATWAELGRHFSDKQLMDVVFTAGQYTQVSMMLNTFGVQLDEGQTLDPDLKGF